MCGMKFDGGMKKGRQEEVGARKEGREGRV